MPNWMNLLNKSAPDFPDTFTWLNTKAKFSLAKLKGCVVILDFWTYCCINCMHTIPVLSKIEEKYAKKPVVVIGVHSAKFDNEKDPENIKEAISRYDIRHAVIVDRNMQLWHEYSVGAWPTIVIIGTSGKIEYKIAGELTFEQLDRLVRDTLEKGTKEKSIAKAPPDMQINIQKKKTTLSYPGKISFSLDKTHFALSDSNHNRILIIDSSSGKITEKIGCGMSGLKDGSFEEVMFFRPQGVFWHADKIYVADTENHAIREIDLHTRAVKTLAGTGAKGFYLNKEITYHASTTPLNSPWDIAVHGRMMYIAMAGLHQIWEYDMRTRLISVFAGSGIENIYDGVLHSAEFAQPSGLWLQGDNMYVADSEVSAVRSISIKEQFVSTIVGTGPFDFGDKVGRLADTKFQHPIGVCGDGKRLYVADTYNGSIKAIDLKGKTTYNVISGKGEKAMCRIDDPECDTLGLFEPNDVKIKGNTLYIADTNNHLVRTFSMDDMILRTLKISE